MAHRRGYTKDDPIDLDAIPDDRKYIPAPRFPGVRRPARPSNTVPRGVEVIALSDDEHGEDLEEAGPSAWVAVHNRRQSSHRPPNVNKDGSPLTRRENGMGMRVPVRPPSTKPALPSHDLTQSDDGGFTAVVEEEADDDEHARPTRRPADEQRAATIPTNIPSTRPVNTGLSESTKPPELSQTRTTTPLSVSTSTAQRSPSSSRAERPMIGAKPAERRQPDRVLSNEPATLADSSRRAAEPLVTAAESFQNQPPSLVISTRNVATDVPPVDGPAAPAPAPPKIHVAAQSTSAKSQMKGLGQGPDSPIGDFTDHNREQITADRVNTRPAIERANTRTYEATKDSSATSHMPMEARSAHVSSAAKNQPKQKAVKSVRSREDRRPRTRFPITQRNPHPAKEGVSLSRLQEELVDPGSSTARSEPSIRRSGSKGALASTSAAAKSDAITRPTTRNIVSESLPVSPPRDGQNGSLSSSTDDTRRPPITVPEPSAPASSAMSGQRQTPRVPNSAAVASSTLAEAGSLPQGNAHMEGLKASNSTNDLPAVAIFADDLKTMSLAVEERLRHILAGRQKAHANLIEVRLKCQRTCQERELRAERRQRKGPMPPILPKKYMQSTSPFKSMQATQVPFDKVSHGSRFADITQEVFTRAKPKDIVTRSAWAVPTTIYKPDAVCVPPFKEYVSLTDNVLADNESKLLATPYFKDEDDQSREKLLEFLPGFYEMKHDEKGPLDLRAEQCRFYKDCVDAFLCEVGLSWDDVLYWLLAPNELINVLNDGSPGGSQFESLLLDRLKYHTEVFKRDDITNKSILFRRSSSNWKGFFSQLKKPTAKRLRLSATACAAVLKECNFSIWYLAQQSETLLKHISTKTRNPTSASNFTYRSAVCRVCHQHNCLIHGELREAPKDSWELKPESGIEQIAASDSESDEDQDGSSEGTPSRHDSDDDEEDDEEDEEDEGKGKEEGAKEDGPVPAHFDSDSDIERLINYKLPANPDAFGDDTELEMIESRGSKPPNGKFNVSWWRNHSYTHMWEKRKPFYPCSHEGSCEEAQCRCYRENINCEKTCRCSRSCTRRFPGCNCASTSGKRSCGASSSCLCKKFNRECDADLCGTCGATEILDPVNRYNENVMEGRCSNVAIQRGVPRKTLLGHSEVHGFGLYMGEDIKKDEYIGEYLGETISVEEGARRLTIYEYQQTMYLFSLNSKQEVDATYMGNKMRFINNAHQKLTNCYAKNFFCNTVFRLALYASKDIKAGTELFFNYNYPKELTLNFKQPKGSSVVAVKQTAKQPKLKTKSKPPRSSSLGQRLDDEERRLQKCEILKRARAEKARKRVARQAEQALQDSASGGRSGPQRARKSAPNQQHQRLKELKTGGRGVKTVRRSNSRDNVGAGESSHEVSLSDDSSDTDDTYDVPLSDKDMAAEDAENSFNRRKLGKAKSRPSMAPVVAVRQKRGGVRTGTGTKRKRPVVFNSDDE